MPNTASHTHTTVGGPSAPMHVHTTPDGHHYLVDGPAESCPAHATAERIIEPRALDRSERRGVAPRVLAAAAVAIALVVAVRRLR
ncbi:hypothetical protein [Georgenia subflava]|uniref:Uncharacterized protein n=1 Tax=Georgenia subflava TaxID=1622177 RepID=A0A6N7EHX3_9MICO|nr:hypothetical protein [Georgenia subflava]MPV36317.1 hypothetical protein [Georgenia subflava]